MVETSQLIFRGFSGFLVFQAYAEHTPKTEIANTHFWVTGQYFLIFFEIV
jgi:hypothetical protein